MMQALVELAVTVPLLLLLLRFPTSMLGRLLGFDTCLMATIDVAAVFQNFAKYLVGSEEVEPGNGWLYSGWLGALAEDPAMEGDDLGVAICNTYYEGCEAVGTQDQTTLSLTDLTKLTPLLEA